MTYRSQAAYDNASPPDSTGAIDEDWQSECPGLTEPPTLEGEFQVPVHDGNFTECEDCGFTSCEVCDDWCACKQGGA